MAAVSDAGRPWNTAGMADHFYDEIDDVTGEVRRRACGFGRSLAMPRQRRCSAMSMMTPKIWPTQMTISNPRSAISRQFVSESPVEC